MVVYRQNLPELEKCLKTARVERKNNTEKLLPAANAEVEFWKSKGFEARLWGSVRNGYPQQGSDIDIFVNYPTQSDDLVKKVHNMIKSNNGILLDSKSVKETCGLYSSFKYKKGINDFDLSFHHCDPTSSYVSHISLNDDMGDIIFCLNKNLKNMFIKQKLVGCLLGKGPSCTEPTASYKGKFMPSLAVKVKKKPVR